MKIAVIGAGIAGMTAAYVLSKRYQVVVYEAADRLGGHTATKTVHHQGREYKIDTGFIVFNDWTYPNFQQLLARLAIDRQPTTMGFSVTCENTGLEYSGSNLNSFFGQRRNLLNPGHWRMLWDIFRFNKEALADVNRGGDYLTMSLGDYLRHKGYSRWFSNHYLIPMGAAIWSASIGEMAVFPLHFFVRFFHNHGLLSIGNRPQWYTVKGGSASYIAPLTAPVRDAIRLGSPVTAVSRSEQAVTVTTAGGDSEDFDQVVIAAHSDQALTLLADASEAERRILGAIPYRDNEVVLHTDQRLLPHRRSIWSSWNYRILDQKKSDYQAPPVLTYNMNSLQSIDSEATFCVTLNKTDAIEPDKILGVYHYAHPVFSTAGIAAQRQWASINGVNRTWFCGAYWANGFHEDGVNSALKVAEGLGVDC